MKASEKRSRRFMRRLDRAPFATVEMSEEKRAWFHEDDASCGPEPEGNVNIRIQFTREQGLWAQLRALFAVYFGKEPQV